jgi:CheY-like chemotaxis protein
MLSEAVLQAGVVKHLAATSFGRWRERNGSSSAASLLRGTGLNSRAEVDPAAENAGAANPTLATTFAPETGIPLIFPDRWELRGGETILLVEDEAFVRKALAEALLGAGYQVLTTATATEALKACSGVNVDLLLSDVVLPGMSGCELAEKFQTRFPQASIVLMSGYTERLFLEEQSFTPVCYLAKPFSSATLLARVEKVLSERRTNAKPA